MQYLFLITATNDGEDPPIDGCILEPCENGGTCIDGVDGYTCHCVPGYTGENCQTGIHFYLIYEFGVMNYIILHDTDCYHH